MAELAGACSRVLLVGRLEGIAGMGKRSRLIRSGYWLTAFVILIRV